MMKMMMMMTLVFVLMMGCAPEEAHDMNACHEMEGFWDGEQCLTGEDALYDICIAQYAASRECELEDENLAHCEQVSQAWGPILRHSSQCTNELESALLYIRSEFNPWSCPNYDEVKMNTNINSCLGIED